MKRMAAGFLHLMLLLLAGCGGGGGGEGGSAPGKAVVKISAVATGAVPAIGDITVTLNLPQGASVQVKPDGSGETADGVVVKSGAADAANTVAVARYSAVSGCIYLQIVKSDGFAPGEFVTVNCDLAPGFSQGAGGFGVADFSAFDLAGNAVSNLEVTRSVAWK